MNLQLQKVKSLSLGHLPRTNFVIIRLGATPSSDQDFQ